MPLKDADLEKAPRGKKRGGHDVLLPLNKHEHKLIKKAAEKSSRSTTSFIRMAALKNATLVLNTEKGINS